MRNKILKYEVLCVPDGHELLRHNVGQQIEYQGNPYKVIEIALYEYEGELNYYHTIVLEPLNYFHGV